MPFYLRKALSFGPIRLNLSKHGVGVSAGVTGARVGAGPKGTYVHGGRHGLYYRKHFSGSEEGTEAGSQGQRRSGGEERYFVDTGATYDGHSGSNPERHPPKLPSLPGMEGPIIAASIGALLFLIGQLSALGATGLLVLAGGLFWLFRARKDQQKAGTTLQKLRQGLEDRKDPEKLLKVLEETSLSAKAGRYVESLFYRDLLAHLFEDGNDLTAERFHEIGSELGISETRKTQEKRVAFSSLLDEVLADHVIDAEEEKQLEELQGDLRLSDEDIAEEKGLIRTMVSMRQAMEGPLEPIDVDLDLKDGESCYFSAEGRFLKENIQDKYQRDRVTYKAIGYDIDLEGTLYLTDRRLLLVGRGSRDYDLKDVLDVTLSLQENVLELTLDGRKNPVIVTTPDIAILCGKLERLIGEEDPEEKT